jgi:hypothetical protein
LLLGVWRSRVAAAIASSRHPRRSNSRQERGCARGVIADCEDVLKERLGTAVRASLVEQKLLGGFDPEQFADSVRGRIAYAMRERLTDAIRERLHEVHRDRLRDAIRSALQEPGGGSGEFAGFGTGMH